MSLLVDRQDTNSNQTVNEGEILNRDSAQSSLRRQLGLGAERPGIIPAERGIVKMTVDLSRSFADALTDKTMFDHHHILLRGDGQYGQDVSMREGSSFRVSWTAKRRTPDGVSVRRYSGCA